MKLYFLRHGLAEDQANWMGTDRDRPLTAIGQEEMQREARTIERLKLGIDLIITSPLTRALQTAEIVARHLNLLDRIIQDERLGAQFNTDDLHAILTTQAESENLMLVGHEPSFSLTISRLVNGGRIVLKKGGLARIDLTDPASMKGELVWLLPPKVLVQ